MPTSARMTKEASIMPGDARRMISPSWFAVCYIAEYRGIGGTR
jgi:hypothetical protein